MKTLKIWNGRDWNSQGSLYVAAYSQKDAVDLMNEAYRKVRGLTDRPDVKVVSLSELRNYFAEGCWGLPMQGVTPERGVWWAKMRYGGTGDDKPVRII